MSTRTSQILQAAFLFLLALALNSGAVAVRVQEQLSDKVIRLHVLANSDSPADQSLKLLVRDRLLHDAAPLLDKARDRREMETLLRESLPALSDAARETLSMNGSSYPVTLELRETEFPTRYYDTFALPAGRYLALRAVIGDGNGHNWWCVVFPPLCGGGVPDTDNDFTAEEISLISRDTAPYVLKFRVVECWERLRQTLARE